MAHSDTGMKCLRWTALAGLWVAQAIWAGGSSAFTVKTPDGRTKMHFVCSESDAAGTRACDIETTELIIPDRTIRTGFQETAEKLAAGGDSARAELCKTLQLIEPRVKEAADIVDLLREGCRAGDSRKLALAYVKMDSLSKMTCQIISRKESVRFAKGGNDTWIGSASHPGACFDVKKYSLGFEGSARKKVVEKTVVYSGANTVACNEEKYIEMSATLKELTDGRIEMPGQCRYLYLQ
jgi:hypothetical protein